MNYQAGFNQKVFLKSKAEAVGTIKTWSDGKKYEKQSNGSWKEVSGKKDTGDKLKIVSREYISKKKELSAAEYAGNEKNIKKIKDELNALKKKGQEIYKEQHKKGIIDWGKEVKDAWFNKKDDF